MKKVLLISPFLIFISLFSNAQIDYQVQIDELYSAADDSDGAGNEDPTWKIELTDNDGGGLQPTGCIAATKAYNTWWTGAPSTGPAIPFSWFIRNNCNATFFSTAMECWEEDGSAALGCDNDECLYSTCSIWNDDDGHAPAGGGNNTLGNTGNINFINDAPCTWNQYELDISGDNVNGSPANYKARISVYWEPNGGIDAGSISGDQAVCENGDPAAFTSTGNGEPANFPTHFTYQWQEDVGCSGTWTDIVGAISATFDAPTGITQSTCFRRLVKSINCSDVISNTLTVTVNTASTDPSSLTGAPLVLCGAGTVDLTVNGGTLGTGGTWVWYDGDPNSGGVLITSSGTDPFIIGQAITASTNYFVRAEGTCGNSNTANVNVVVSSPSTAPTGVTVTSSTICLGNTTDLTVLGGSLGSGATWTWYDTDPTIGAPAWLSSSASTSYLGLSPATTTTYYVRAEGCDTTVAVQTTITVTTASTAPSSITADPTILCGAGTVDLTLNGGSLGTGATWEWYDGDPNGAGIFLFSTGTDPFIIGQAITASTNYFVRAEGGCGPSNTVNVNVVVSTPNTAPTGVTVTSSTICAGNTTDLTVIGGVLGSGSSWTWYDTDPTIGSPLAVFNSTTTFLYSGVSPIATTTYYVRAEGCDTTAAVQTTITVTAPSVEASGISATQTSLCTGGGSTLEIQGGTLGAGANWVWYEGGCGAGSSIFSGTALTINVTPTVTTSYYVRAEGGCNGNTTCVNITISIEDPSVDPTSIASPNTDLCLGETTVLSVSGGALGTGATWEWYQGSCGGISVGQGTSISVLPSSTTIYYVRAEGACGNTICVDITVTVGIVAANPTSAAVSVNNICPGDTTQLSVTGPVLDPGYTWVWYTGACGAVPAGVGTTLNVFPTITTTYYVRAVGTCGETNCVSVTVDVLDAAIMASGITADNNYFCTGDSAVLELYGGTLVAGAGWVWYENSCGGTPIGTGTTITVSPATNTAYFVRAEGGTCGNTACVNISINVLDAYSYMTPFDTLCGMGYPFDLANGVPEGGVYSGTGINNGIFDPILAGIGTHDVTYTFTEDNGCIAIATGEIVIDSNDLVASVTIVPETCAEGGITLVGSTYGGSGFYIYEWSNGFIGNPLQYVDTGTYSVIVVDGSNCVSVISDIMVNEDVACIEMPNSFTPNNDGTNDMWNLDFSSYSNGSIQVYSKWGNLVWESAGTMLSWDGTYNGQVLPSGTYYYILDIDNGTLTQNGPVTIVK